MIKKKYNIIYKTKIAHESSRSINRFKSTAVTSGKSLSHRRFFIQEEIIRLPNNRMDQNQHSSDQQRTSYIKRRVGQEQQNNSNHR